MSFSVGIIGLPNVGKSTLFKALTQQSVDISNYPFCTIDPNVGIVTVPDKRLEAIYQTVNSQKMTPTVIEFVDIAGLVKNAHQGEGLGNQFLAHIRHTDALCQVVRVFNDEKITHLEGAPDPQRDIKIINTELIMKDIESVDKRLDKIQKKARAGEKEALQEVADLEIIKKILTQGKLIFQHQQEINLSLAQELCLLTLKPMIYLFNGNEADFSPPDELNDLPYLVTSLENELAWRELTPLEAQELKLPPSQLNHLIRQCYQILNLITFFTITGGKETRAWTIKKGEKAPQAGGVVHSDFEEKFIRAEVINWEKLIAAGGWLKAREKGLIRTEGKDYLVQDGDVIEFKI